MDLLRVQACQDVAAVHELKMALQSQKEGDGFLVHVICASVLSEEEEEECFS